MIQHVENLKRMYAKEHAELEELKQVLLQNERSFMPNTKRERGKFSVNINGPRLAEFVNEAVSHS